MARGRQPGAIAKSAALSLDSLVLTSEGTLYDHGFFRSIQTGTLQLNHSRVERQDKVLTKVIVREMWVHYGPHTKRLHSGLRM